MQLRVLLLALGQSLLPELVDSPTMSDGTSFLPDVMKISPRAASGAGKWGTTQHAAS
jgi:hypothetical protein